MYESALKLRNAGLSIVVLGDDKSKPLGGWTQFQSERITPTELKKKCDFRAAKNIAIIGGKVSGQLCQLDFDDHHSFGCVFNDWLKLVEQEFDGPLFCNQLAIHKTPNHGFHVRWRVETDERLASSDLASRWLSDRNTGEMALDPKGKPKKEAIIEMRAEGLYCLCPPSHGYKRIQGSLLSIPVITYEDHKRLIALAELFNTAVEVPTEKKSTTEKRRTSDGLSPGDDFNERGDYGRILVKHGWTLVHSSGSKTYWKHPTTENLTSATWNCCPHLPERFYCFSPNTPFEQKKPYHRFAIYTLLECGGTDPSHFREATKRLAVEGFGEQRKPQSNQRTKKGSYVQEARVEYIEQLIRQYFQKGRKIEEVLRIALEQNQKKCNPPLDEDTIKAIVHDLKPRLPTQTGTELLAKDIPPPNWAVEDFIPEGLTIFAGKPKIGKSWLMLGVSLAVALGGKALGEIDVDGGDVLYCALEDNERRLQNRLEILLPDGAKPDRFHYIALGDLPKMDRGGLDMIGTFLDDKPKTRLVVVDTLQKFKAHGNSKRNAYEEDYDVFGVLQQFAMSRGIALVLVHHMRKADAEYELDEISGSTGATGASDSILILKRSVDGITLYRQGRDVIEETFAVDFDSETCIWTLQGEAKEVHMSRARQQIVQVLEGTDEGMTAKTLAASCAKNFSTIRTLLGKLVAEGVLVKIGGHYAVSHSQKEEEYEVF